MRDRIIQLQESAESLGFGTIQQALDAGYHEVQDLVKGEFKLEKVEDLTNKAYRELHETWERERQAVRADLRTLLDEAMVDGDVDTIKALERTLQFVEGVEIFL